MDQPSTIVCFHCGQAVGDPPRWNTHPSGAPCRVCADRLLESLPPIFHAPLASSVSPAAVADELRAELDESRRDAPDGGQRA